MSTPSLHRFEFKAMGSPCKLLCYGTSEATVKSLQKAVLTELIRLEKKYSRFRDDSVVSEINQSSYSGQWVAVDAETDALLNYAAVIHGESNGLFDITSGVLRNVWDFKKKEVPTTIALSECLRLVGWNQVERKVGKVRLKTPGMEIDFGGIVKEYAVDACLSVLRRKDTWHSLIDLGGDVGVTGPRADGTPWMVGVRDPRNPEISISVIPLVSGCVATSGDYERYFEINGKRYCHLLNPQTGWPVTESRSVSVWSEQCVIAGSASTTAMLMSESKSEAWLAELGLPYLKIGKQGEIRSSYGLLKK